MDYQAQLAEWKAKHGLEPNTEHSPDELAMMHEDHVSSATDWCLGCDQEMPVAQMKLITRRIDPYVQFEGSAGDYIAKGKRVRMCPKCFEERYGTGA